RVRVEGVGLLGRDVEHLLLLGQRVGRGGQRDEPDDQDQDEGGHGPERDERTDGARHGCPPGVNVVMAGRRRSRPAAVRRRDRGPRAGQDRVGHATSGGPLGGQPWSRERSTRRRAAPTGFRVPPRIVEVPARNKRQLTGGTYFSRGSSASRRPSPNRLNPSTVTKMARPGKSESHGLAWMKATLALRSQPQLGVGGCVPRPRKLSVASTMIEVAMPRVVVTIIGARQFGRTWRARISGSRTPRARQASM